MNQVDLDGRRALITGGAQGVGLSITKRLLASGASVSIWDCNQEVLAAAVDELRGHGTVQPSPIDVTDAVAVHRAAASSAQFLSRINILITTSSLLGRGSPCCFI